MDLHIHHGCHGVKNNIHVLMVTEFLDGGFGDVKGAVVVQVITFVDVPKLTTLTQGKTV